MNHIKPVIFCIAKLEHRYIEEFVKHHLSIGFDMIYIYDNEDQPTYQNLLKHLDKVYVIHYPGKARQNTTLECFTKNIMQRDSITHVMNIDCDEFVILKKHNNIKEFINEYIKDDCAGIGINWRFFGDSGKKEYQNEPIMKRFTMCQRNGDHHVKTLFDKKYYKCFNTMHHVHVTDNKHIKCTNGTIVTGPYNPNIDISVIQLNHYKTKTFEEFKFIRQRGYADSNNYENEEGIINSFNAHNINEVEDLTAYNYYIKNLSN
jgi:hypothetical protein